MTAPDPSDQERAPVPPPGFYDPDAPDVPPDAPAATGLTPCPGCSSRGPELAHLKCAECGRLAAPRSGHVNGATPPAEGGPTRVEPLRGLPDLAKVAVVGRERIRELADRPIVWIWDYVATAGLTVLLAAGPGGGKTTLLLLLIVARLNKGEPVSVLGRAVAPAPDGKYVVVIENEHSDESSARMLIRSCTLLHVEDTALDRVILVARGSVRIGSPAWEDVERLIAAALVSDVMLDTLARCTSAGDSNDEQDQVQVFDRIAKAIELAPTAADRPTFWIGAHTRKSEGTVPSMNDVSGSTQRAGQSDVVICMGAKLTDGCVSSVSVHFRKVREKDADDWPRPVEYAVSRARGIEILDGKTEDKRPLETQILELLEREGKPMTKSGIADRLGRSRADVQVAVDTLFKAGDRLEGALVKASNGREYPAIQLKHPRTPGPATP